MGADSRVLVSELGSWDLDGPGDSTEAGESPLELAMESHLRCGPIRPKQAQRRASAPVSSGSPCPRQSPGPSPGVSAPVSQIPYLFELPLPSRPRGRKVPKAGVARASSTGPAGQAASPALPASLNYLSWARDPPPPPRFAHLPAPLALLALLASSPCPLVPYLTTSPSFSHHVRTSGPPQNAAQSNPSVGNPSQGTG